MVNNSAIIIIFSATSKCPAQKSQRGIASTVIIEIVGKELSKYEVENVRWGYMTDEHGNAVIFLSLVEGEKAHTMEVTLHACFLTGNLLCKGTTQRRS